MTKSPPVLDESRLVDLLERQRALYGRLRLVADRQKPLVMREDPQPLLALLAERQKLVDALAALNAELSPYRQQWSSFYGGLGETSRRQVACLLEEANSTMTTILQGDSRDTATLSARRQEMSSRIAAADVAHRVSVAYAAAGVGRPTILTDAKA